MPALDSNYYKKGDGQLSLKLREIEDENAKLKQII